MPLIEVLEWRYKAIREAGPTMSDNNLRLQVILNALTSSPAHFDLRRPVQENWLRCQKIPRCNKAA